VISEKNWSHYSATSLYIALCKGVWGDFDEKFQLEFFHSGDKYKVEETTNHFGVIEFANARA